MRKPSGKSASKPKNGTATSDRLVPAHVRDRMPQMDQFEGDLALLFERASLSKLSGDPGPVPESLRSLLPDCLDIDRLRRAGAVVASVCGEKSRPESHRDFFKAFALLRALSNPDQLAEVMAFLVGEVAEKSETGSTPERQAAKCYAATAGQAWQCGSLFPTHAEDYAAWIRMWFAAQAGNTGKKPTLEAPSAPVRSPRGEYQAPGSPPSDADMDLLAKLLLSGGLEKEPDRCGFMTWRAADAAAVTESEYNLRYGQVDRVLKPDAGVKCAEYEIQLARSSFNEEWGALKRRFPAETADAARHLFRRTLMRERKWQGDDIAKFDTEAQRFQALFDLLCWKYCLWGVENDRPLLMKPSVSLTPYGTQVFIPAYMSLDAARDLDLGYISKLHKARGVRRQGDKLSAGREPARQKCIEAAQADAEARQDGLKGEARMKHIKKFIKKSAQTDDAEILRMVKRGRALLADAAKRCA